MLRFLVVAAAATVGALKPPNARMTRGVPNAKWHFDVLAREPAAPAVAGDPVADVELVARDGKGEIGWFELFFARASDDAGAVRSHGGRHYARLIGEDDVDRAFGKNMMVDTSARRRGVASRLLAAAEDVARGWNLSEFVITAVKSHEPSRRLYEKLGFSEVPAELATDSESVVLRKFVPTATPTE